ncbi:MAG TPA: hypothetical protein VGR91_06215 [Stellaceae bacterium]|nr:hypothetical protein [Stellaceae bacterium]
MIRFAFGILCAAVLTGSALAILYARGAQPWPPHRAAAPIHGMLGAAGLVALVLALVRGLPRSHMGTGGFAPLATGLVAAAFCLGLVLALTSWHRGRPAGALVGAHASLAIAGFVVLSVLVALG